MRAVDAPDCGTLRETVKARGEGEGSSATGGPPAVCVALWMVCWREGRRPPFFSLRLLISHYRDSRKVILILIGSLQGEIGSHDNGVARKLRRFAAPEG